jgi:peptide/nickel transport system permease protein
MEPAAQNPIALKPVEMEHLSPSQLFWRRLRRQRIAVVGAVILAVLYTMALLAGFVAPYHYERMDRQRFFHPPTGLKFRAGKFVVPRYTHAEGSFKYAPSPSDYKPIRFFVRGDKYKWLGLVPSNLHLFGTDDPVNYPVYLLGTDQYGRDIFSRLLSGSQISLSIGLIGIAISFSFGMLIGGIAGYFGGLADNVIMRLSELLMSIPGLYLIMALRMAFPPKLSSVQMYLLIVVILSFVRWAASARVIRGMALSIRERQFVLAARSLGQSNLRVIVKHLLPNTFSYVIVAATLSIPYYILGEVVLSFLNVGIQEPDASWGIMLNAAQNPGYLTDYPWLLAPGVAIFVTVLAFNFLGDGLRDAVDTKAS